MYRRRDFLAGLVGPSSRSATVSRRLRFESRWRTGRRVRSGELHGNGRIERRRRIRIWNLADSRRTVAFELESADESNGRASIVGGHGLDTEQRALVELLDRGTYELAVSAAAKP